jgi:outer membrane protein assembly factor BamB
MLVAVLSGGAADLAVRVPPAAFAAPSASPTVINVLAPFNNVGISSDANPTTANFDAAGASYSNDALTAAGFAPGQNVTVGSYAFQWVTPAQGTPDNWQQAEQAIPFSTSANSIAFLGAAADGPSTGTGFVHFTDGSAQSFTLTFSDWTLGGGGAAIAPGDTVAVVTPYRNTPTGKQTVQTYVFETTISLPSGKTVVSVTLPRTVNQGAIHIFAIAAAPVATSASVKGISNDSIPTQGNLDGGSRSYSNNALDATGLAGGMPVSVYGFTAQWPVVAPTANDTWSTYGAVVPLTGAGTALEILGAAVNGASSGTATITYADGTIQPFTLAFSDWTLGGGGSQQLSTNYIVSAMPYRDTATGKQLVTTYVFATLVGLWQGKPLRSLTLPASETGGRVVVLAAAVGTASAPTNLAAISSDSALTANFDGGGRSYSNNALAAAGLPSGRSVAIGGYQFRWPTNAANTSDAWQASGQVIPVMSTSSGLAFLGAAANGASFGAATITYTDGTAQTVNLAFSDWTLGGGGQQLLSGESVAATMSYRNTSSGPQQVATYVFFTSVALATGKSAQSVTLPAAVSGGSLNVFAVSGTPATSSQASNTWPTYLENPGHTSYDSAETTLSASNAGQLQLKWTAHGQQGISVQPVFSNGLMYWGSWDGLMHATNSSGSDVWTANLGQQTVATCVPSTVGVASTATVGAIGATAAVFVAGGNHTVYALNASTGAVLWVSTLTTTTDYFIWDSPVVFENSLYIGISSFGDCPNSIGKLYRLDLATGAIENMLVLATASCTGDGIWGSPTADVTTGALYFATGDGCASDPNAYAIEAVSAGDLTLIDRWEVPAAQLGGDSDFGNTPTLFTAVINGVSRPMVGVANKNGYYYAFDRTKLSAGPLWSVQLATGGECPICGDGSISPSAWDGTTLYVAAGNTTINGTSCTSSISAINPATGAFAWRHCTTSGPILGAVLASPGLVIADSKTTVNVLSASTGSTLFQYQDSSSTSYFYSAPALANGILYAANDDGNLYAFG